MLKALELVGFKSFADKTHFEFPPGITVVVGPNGSGKSNVVDAVKWVLGEQSVKSLRGKEMADVIFNGSGGRKAMNSAEATLTFDNAQRLLTIDTPQVHITRRVYRSGEGEYLINRQPCRLRDIRDLFAGTGAATEAYSVIEQGKVDVLLQASPRDRRIIFEEAAGISRFKAKKIEATRRLERVDQNLLRLSDIVEEVESRLRSVRLQAAKARRYKEHTDRLQELRTQVGLHDWRKLSEKIGQIDAELEEIRRQASEATAEAEAAEAGSLQREVELSDSDQALRACEASLARNREQIAARESTVEHERLRCRELEEEVVRHRGHLAAMSSKAGDLEEQLRITSAALDEAEAEFQRVREQLTLHERSLTDADGRLAELRRAAEARRARQMDRMRTAAALSNQISALDARIAAATAVAEQRRAQVDELEPLQHELAERIEGLQRAERELTEKVAALHIALRAGTSALAASRRELQAAQKELAQLQARHTGAAERAAVLEELQRRLEGVDAGVKQVLTEARSATTGPWTQVRGMVADLLEVSVDMAPVIEVALGDAAQHLVVAPRGSANLLEYLASKEMRLPGRVAFVLPEESGLLQPGDRVELGGRAGVVGRADVFVRCEAEYLPLVRRLLANTWVVENLETALVLSRAAGRGATFVTLRGELLSDDGTLHVGPRNTALGLISRRSELLALQETIAELGQQMAAQEEVIAGLERRITQQDREVQDATAQHEQAAESLNREKLRLGAALQQQAEQQKRLEVLSAELAAAQTQRESAAQELGQGKEQLAQADAELAALEEAGQADDRVLAELDQQRSTLAGEVTRGQVQRAKSEQRLESLRRQRQQLSREGEERGRALAENRHQLAQCTERAQQGQRAILLAGGEIAEFYLQKEQIAAEVVRHNARREEIRRERAALQADAQHARARAHKLEEKVHARELSVGSLRHEKASLAARLREDYGIELAELEHEPSAEELHEREAVEQEIAELRRKINNIGNVNLDALAELEELEARFGSLSAQYQDLSKAKASLEQIIGKINADSRRLFAETLETVRGHFQILFRKLFGGGQADIVLDEGEDILESGIEIVARPPGKEPRSISLLSGGEKTLTCVALLLAIFRSRPSPFCILDEVDAALDEANIERFVGVIKEFLAWTQFIVVTHSKKTMTCASTLYGVTMQESGVSKRVSVRFEDVSEGGHIDQAAIDQGLNEPAPAPIAEDETQAA